MRILPAVLLLVPCVAQAQSTIYSPTAILVQGQPGAIEVKIAGGESISGIVADVAIDQRSGVQMIGAAPGDVWQGNQVFASPPNPPLPAQRSVFNFGILSGSVAANGVVGTLVVDVPEEAEPGVYLLTYNAQFSQVVLPDATVEDGTQYLFGAVVVLPEVGGEPPPFVDVLAQLIRIYLYRIFGFPLI